MLRHFIRSLLASLCMCSLVFPMRQVVQVALARTMSQSAAMHNSLTARCPVLSTLIALNITDVLLEEHGNNSVENITKDFCDKKQQNTMVDHEALEDLSKKGKDNSPNLYVKLNPDLVGTNWKNETSVLTDQELFSCDRDAGQRAQYVSDKLYKYNLAELNDNRLLAMQSQVCIASREQRRNAENKAHTLLQPCSGLSNYELRNKKFETEKVIPELKTEFQSLIQKDARIDFFVNHEKHGDLGRAMLSDLSSKLTQEECFLVDKALGLKSEIAAREAAAESIEYQIKQSEYKIASNIEQASIQILEKEILPDLLSKKDSITSSIMKCEHELAQIKSEWKDIDNQVNVLRNSGWVRHKDAKIKNLEAQKKPLDIKCKELEKELASLQCDLRENNVHIQHAQKSIDDKKQIELQEAQLEKERQEQKAKLLQEQEKQDQAVRLAQEQYEYECGREREQEFVHFYDGSLQRQYESLNFDPANCPNKMLEENWSQRQEALDKTIEQNYMQSEQEFLLSPQILGYLKAYNIDYKEYQTCSGTALQHQFHGEICNIISQAASLQLETSYQNNLLNGVVYFVDAAHDANKNQQLLLVSQLLDSDFIILKLSRAIIKDPISFIEAFVSGVADSAAGLGHMAINPAETCKHLAKGIYFILETVAVNDPENLLRNPEIFQSLRDQRNAEIAAGLKNLGQEMNNATELEQFKALVRFGADCCIPHKILQGIGSICGGIIAEAKIMRTLEGAASMLEQDLKFQEIAEEIALATEKGEKLAQKSIGKQLVTELLEAEKPLDTAVTNVAGNSAEAIEKFNQTLKDLLKDLVRDQTKSNSLKQYFKNGSYNDAIKDFYSLQPSNVRKLPKGKEGLHGILADGREINVRLESSAKTPTLEIVKSGGGGMRIKIRYEYKT